MGQVSGARLDYEGETPVLWVRPSSPVKSIANLIVEHLEETGNPVILRAVGAGAVNQMVKASAHAAQYLAGRALSMAVKPGFQTVPGKDQRELSACILRCFLLRD